MFLTCRLYTSVFDTSQCRIYDLLTVHVNHNYYLRQPQTFSFFGVAIKDLETAFFHTRLLDAGMISLNFVSLAFHSVFIIRLFIS